MSKLSLGELTKLYSASNKAPSPLEPTTALPGVTTLEKLSKLQFSRESSKLFAAPSRLAILPASSKQTVAVCLVIVDELFHEAIWREWVEQGEASGRYEARLFIHAKHPERISSLWVRSCLLKGKTFKPEWNSPEVIRAMLATLEEAIDPKIGAGRFVFGTESCIPIHPLEVVGDALFAEDVSWLNAFDTGKSNWETEACFRAVDATVIPPRSVWKTIPGWMMLTRRHAAEIINLRACVGHDLVQAWGPGGQWRLGYGVFAPEEVFFSTLLAILGYLKRGGGGLAAGPGKGGGGSAAAGSASATATASATSAVTTVSTTIPQPQVTSITPPTAASAPPRPISTLAPSALDEVRRKMVTYATWARQGEANPVSFAELTPALLAECRQGGCLFARKFAKGAVPLEQWRSLVCPSSVATQESSSRKKRARSEDDPSES